jgi:NAD(P)-dependent dehydrogenase (short-subunit alcohol dehydrogenase family)
MGLLEAHAGLAGKVAVVIGGAFGNGRAVTMALAKAGIDIALCDNDDDSLREIVPEIQALGRKVTSMHVDVRDPDALERFYDGVAGDFERLDIVVNLAGGVKRLSLEETTREQNASEIRLNYGYVIDSVRRAIPLIRKGARGGSIINFTTIEAHRGAATFAVYAGAKAATTNFTRCMAVELGADRIRVNTLAPDATPARGSGGSIGPRLLADLEAMGPGAMAPSLAMYVPMGEAPTADDLADGVLFLASDLSRMITGTTLHVDGGTIVAMGFLNWPHGDGYMPAPLSGSMKRLFGNG